MLLVGGLGLLLLLDLHLLGCEVLSGVGWLGGGLSRLLLSGLLALLSWLSVLCLFLLKQLGHSVSNPFRDFAQDTVI